AEAGGSNPPGRTISPSNRTVSFMVYIFLGLLLLFLVILTIGLTVGGGSSPTTSSQVALEEIDDLDKLVSRAESHENNGEWGEAIKAWSRYLELEPESFDVMFRRGHDHYRAGDYEFAIEDLERVLEELDDPPSQIRLYLARCWGQLNRHTQSLSYFRDYIDEHPEDIKTAFEAARYARNQGKFQNAREIYRTIRDHSEHGDNQYLKCMLELTETAIDEGNAETASKYIDELKEFRQTGEFTNTQELQYLYAMARLQELKGNQPDADRLYRKIYERNPEFRNVTEIVEDQIAEMSQSELIKKFLKMNRDDLAELCEEIVKNMGYEPLKSIANNPEEIDVHARERAQMLKVNRILIAFKQWKETLGEMPVKEFELKMMEDRFDQGYLVCPGGFNHQAQEYADDSPDLNLMGPEQLLKKLPDSEHFLFE
ncbi:MAG: restriction endonuclease, partial [bacterium]